MSTNELTAVVPPGPVTINGVTYAGVHAMCQHQKDSAAAEYRDALAQARRHGDADAAIGRAIRRLLYPGTYRRDGVKRKTYRRDELQAIVDAADRAATG